MLAFAGFTLSWAPLLPPVAVQVRLSSAKLAGGPPSVTLQLPAGTLTQSSVLVELSTPALSFNVKADGVGSDVQLGVVEVPTGSGMFDVKLKVWLTSAPQQGTPSAGTSHWLAAPLVTHLDRLSVGTPLPPKSKVTSMSPAVRSLVTPFALAVLLWLNSKSRCAEPCVFVRSKARYR